MNPHGSIISMRYLRASSASGLYVMMPTGVDEVSGWEIRRRTQASHWYSLRVSSMFTKKMDPGFAAATFTAAS